MNYKERIDALKALFLSTEPEAEVKKEEVKLEEEPKAEESKTEAPATEYVSLAQFNELKDKLETYVKETAEMLSTAMEMINATEKNTVPVEASKQEEEEEKVEELAAEPVKHNPEEVVSNSAPKVSLRGGADKTFEDRAFETWINSISK